MRFFKGVCWVYANYMSVNAFVMTNIIAFSNYCQIFKHKFCYFF